MPFKFEGFFLIGFFLFLFFLLAQNIPIAALGVAFMLFAFIIDYEKKRFFNRDIFMLGYAFATALVVVSFIKKNLLAFFLSILGMAFALLLYTLHKRHLLKEKHKKILQKHPTHKFVPSRAPKVSVFLNANMWSLIAVTVLLFAGFLANIFLLALGLLLAIFALVLQTIKIRTLRTRFKALVHRNIIDMKEEIKTNRSRYETDFDKLLRIVQKHRTVRISDVAKIFNISTEKAEEWGKLLEENGLLHVHFPAIGEAELQWK